VSRRKYKKIAGCLSIAIEVEVFQASLSGMVKRIRMLIISASHIMLSRWHLRFFVLQLLVIAFWSTVLSKTLLKSLHI